MTMAINEQDLTRIASFLEGGLDAPGEFRRHFPGLSFTRCDAADLSEEPFFRRYAGFDLYLVDGRSHCWRITSDPARATGVVIAGRN